MFSSLQPRRWAGAAALLIVGLAAGCRHTQHRQTAHAGDSCSACANAAVAAAAPIAASAPVARSCPAVTCAPKSCPLPPVCSERYVKALSPSPQIVVAEKPKMLLPPAATEPVEAPAAVNIPPANGRGDAPARRSFPDITARPEFAHAADYTSLTGELSFMSQKNQWRLRYTSIDDEDKYGGAVTLDAIQQMKGFRAGQLVCVKGAMVDAESRQPSPLYRVVDIEPVKK